MSEVDVGAGEMPIWIHSGEGHVDALGHAFAHLKESVVLGGSAEATSS